MEDLKFVGPTLLPSYGEEFCTVRKGRGWGERTELGSELRLWCCREYHGGDCSDDLGCEFVGRGEVLAIWMGHLAQLPASILEFHNEPQCHFYYGLRARMKDIYGAMTETDECSALIVKRTE